MSPVFTPGSVSIALPWTQISSMLSSSALDNEHAHFILLPVSMSRAAWFPSPRMPIFVSLLTVHCLLTNTLLTQQSLLPSQMLSGTSGNLSLTISLKASPAQSSAIDLTTPMPCSSDFQRPMKLQRVQNTLARIANCQLGYASTCQSLANPWLPPIQVTNRLQGRHNVLQTSFNR